MLKEEFWLHQSLKSQNGILKVKYDYFPYSFLSSLSFSHSAGSHYKLASLCGQEATLAAGPHVPLQALQHYVPVVLGICNPQPWSPGSLGPLGLLQFTIWVECWELSLGCMSVTHWTIYLAPQNIFYSY